MLARAEQKRPQVSLEPYQVRGDGKLRHAFQRNTHIDVPQNSLVRKEINGKCQNRASCVCVISRSLPERGLPGQLAINEISLR